MKDLESRFEELENIMNNNEVLQEIVTDLKNDAIELQNALIVILKWHYKYFEENEECRFDCPEDTECIDCIHVKICDYKNIIEKATEKTWAEIIKEKRDE